MSKRRFRRAFLAKRAQQPDYDLVDPPELAEPTTVEDPKRFFSTRPAATAFDRKFGGPGEDDLAMLRAMRREAS